LRPQSYDMRTSTRGSFSHQKLSKLIFPKCRRENRAVNESHRQIEMNHERDNN